MLAQKLVAKRQLLSNGVVDGGGDADTTWIGKALEARGDVDPAAIDVALVDNYLVEINTDTEPDLAVIGKRSVAHGEMTLYVDGTGQGEQTVKNINESLPITLNLILQTVSGRD